MLEPRLFSEVGGLSISVSRSRGGYYELHVATHLVGEPWDDRLRASYELLSLQELADALLEELWQRLAGQ